MRRLLSLGARFAIVSLLAFGTAGAFAADPPAAAREPGDQWEVTAQMSMPGMPMAIPARTQKVCAPKTWSEPPAGNQDSTCQVSDFVTTPSKTTWKMKCAGGMSGSGEINRTSPDAYTGQIKMASEQGEMLMNLTGRKVGECDAAESRHQMAQTQAQIEKIQKDGAALASASSVATCKLTIEPLDLPSLKRQESLCAEHPEVKTSFCARFATQDGFKLTCDRKDKPGNEMADLAAYCGKDVAAVRKAGCDEALKKEQLDVLGPCCPAEVQVIAKRECAGRDYTSMATSKYAGFCVTYAREMMAGGQTAPPPAAPPAKTKKSLKDFLPH